MDLITFAMLAGIGVASGIIASIVGGAAVVAYPVLLAVGLSPQAAVITNSVALSPAVVLAALSDRAKLPRFNRDFFTLIAVSFSGAAIGALLLAYTPERAFNVIVPLLLGFATILFAQAQKLSEWLRERARRRGHEISFNVTSLKVLLPVSFYNGYFGAGAGVLVLGVMMLATGGDYRSANTSKNFVSGINNCAAALVFALSNSVSWPHVLAMMGGTVVGGQIGAYVARIIPARIIRVVVIVVGVVLTASFAWRYWFSPLFAQAGN